MRMLATEREETIDSAKGLKIFVRSWSPESKPRAVVVVCHGVTRGPEVIVQIRTTPRPRSLVMEVPYGFDWALIRLTIRSAVSAVAIDGVPRS